MKLEPEELARPSGPGPCARAAGVDRKISMGMRTSRDITLLLPISGPADSFAIPLILQVAGEPDGTTLTHNVAMFSPSPPRRLPRFQAAGQYEWKFTSELLGGMHLPFFFYSHASTILFRFIAPSIRIQKTPILKLVICHVILQ